jgi:hypothetical protein
VPRLPVGAAAFGVSFLFMAVARPADRVLLRACLVVLAVEAAVGLAGFALHVRGDLARPAARLLDRALHGAPLFAPLLFPNLSLLAALGLWAGLRAAEAPARAEP